jgi:hypothetical protein
MQKQLRRSGMIVDEQRKCRNPEGVSWLRKKHVIPSGFDNSLAIFYNPAIPSGLNCVR